MQKVLRNICLISAMNMGNQGTPKLNEKNFVDSLLIDNNILINVSRRFSPMGNSLPKYMS